MSINFDNAKRKNKRFQRSHKKIMRMIVKEMDFNDKHEVRAYQYLQDASETFDSILAWMEEQDKNNSK